MDWYNFCKTNFDLGIATKSSLKVYVEKEKITSEQYKEVTGIEYEATIAQ